MSASHNILSFSTRAPLPWWKRGMDIAGSVAALPLLVPLVVLMLIVTRIWSPGPVLFRQERVGYNGRRFTLFKFRTMQAGASVAAHQAHALDFIRNNRPMEKLDTAGDARLIPLGRILRATGLDELPQVINVLLGEMSLVGPRPCIAYEFDAYLPWQRERFNAVPGLTGLWQVSGKNHLTFEEMIHLDIRYARSLSPGRDLGIILKTPAAILVQVKETFRQRVLPAQGPIRPTAIPPPPSYRELAVERNARRQLVQFRYSESSVARDSFAGDTLP